MKHVFLIILIFCFFIPISFAATVTVDVEPLRYTVDTDAMTAEVYGPISRSNTITDLVIPDYIGYEGSEIPVTSIGRNAFYEIDANRYLKGSLTIGNNVQTIGELAFYHCSNLTGTLTIGDNVQLIGIYAFSGCKGFKGSLTIGDKVQTIGDTAFYGCSGFTGLLTIGNNVQTIGDDAFSGCSGFTGSLTIPDNVQTIGDRAFNKCSGFTGSLTIGHNVQTIGGQAFRECTGLTGSLTIPNSVLTMGYEAFYKCSGFTGSLTIGNSLQIIDYRTFQDCSGLTGSLTISHSVTTINQGAFQNCSSLTKVIFGDSVTTIGDGAFRGCNNLQGVYISDLEAWCRIDFNNNISNPLEYARALYLDNSPISNLTIPESITEIKQYTFYYAKNITGSLFLHENITSIGDYAFCYCDSITGILKIPDSVINIGRAAFSDCSGFTSVICNAIQPPTTASNVFSSTTYDSACLYVPSQSVSTYKSATSWKEFKCINPIKVQPTSISINPSETSLLIGQTFEIDVTITPDEAWDAELTWSSSDSAIASVDENGKMTAVSVGEAVITVETENGLSATCKVTVNPVLASTVTISVPDKEIFVGDKINLSAVVEPANTTDNKVTWSSDNTAIAPIDPVTGELTAVAPGEVTITATCGEVSGTAKITVKPILANSVTLSAQDLSLLVGQTDKLTATVSPENTTYPTVTWKSDNEAVATVDVDGTVTAVSVGESNITASCGEVSATCKVTVNPVLASSVTISVPDKEIFVGDKVILSAVVEPTNTTDSKVTWSSDNTVIATIDPETGELIAVAPGEVTVTATCGEVYGTAEITVKPILANSVTLSAQDLSLLVGQTEKLTATVSPENTTYPTVTWKSDNEAVATVDVDGTVTAVSVGESNITASCGEVSATCKVTVNPVLATSISIDGDDIHVLKETETLQLTATVLPDNTTYQEISWESSDDSIASVSDVGLVTAVATGEVDITVYVVYQPEIKATYHLTVEPRILGDANDNGVVNVADVGTISDYIVNKPVYQFCFVNADVITDGRITTADVTATVDIIFNDGPSLMKLARARKIAEINNNELVLDDFNSYTDLTSNVGIGLINPSDFVGLQASVLLPQGMSVRNVRKGKSAKNHILNYNITDSGTLDFILYSLNNDSLGNEGSLLVIEAVCEKSCENINVENILASDGFANEYTLTFTGGKNNGLETSLESIEQNDIFINVLPKGIMILNAKGENVNIFNLTGEVISSKIAVANKEFYPLASGIYIVNVKNTTTKLIVK